MFNKIFKKAIIFSCIFCLLFVICIPRKKAHAIAPVVALPAFASAVGGVTFASVAATFGIVALVGAGCYGVYKLSQPSTQQAIKDWASSEVEAFQAGKTDWGVYVDSEGKYFMDNADKLKQDFNNKFNPDDDTKKNKKMIPSFPVNVSSPTSGSKGVPWYDLYYKNSTDNSVYVTVNLATSSRESDNKINWNSYHNPTTNTFTVPAHRLMIWVAGNYGADDPNNAIYFYCVEQSIFDEYLNDRGYLFWHMNNPVPVGGINNTLNWSGFLVSRTPYIVSVVDDNKTSFPVYPNVDNALPIPTEFPDISKSIQITPSVDPTTVTKDANLTKVTPISQSQIKPTNATEPDNKTKPNTKDDTKPDTTDSTLPDSVSIDFTPIEHAGEEFTNKFPFCLPWDIARSFSDLNSIKGTAPKWNIQFPKAVFGADANFTIDFAQFEKFAIIIRWGLTALFIVCLIWGTRKIIGS